MDGNKRVFVTVGTTKFEKLIDKMSSDAILQILENCGYNSIQFQIGAGKLWYNKQQKSNHSSIDLKYSRYVEKFSEEIEKSDLIISHAGAGTCLEVLKHNKPLIVVINEDLMNNHQTELAEQLANNSYLYCCTVDTLETILEENLVDATTKKLKAYPVANTELFATYLNQCMGFNM